MRTKPRGSSIYDRRRMHLRLEELESRCVPSRNSIAPVSHPVAETLDQAQDLQLLPLGGQLTASGNIGTGPAGSADVNFYRFTLAQASVVHLATGSQLKATLSLYDTDPSDPLGHHLVVQNDGAGQGGHAAIDQTLGAGTYFIGISGSGNDYFNPFLVGSGYAGSTGAYTLQITAEKTTTQLGAGPALLVFNPSSDAAVQPGNGPLVLSFDPTSGAVVNGNPLQGAPLTRLPAAETPATEPKLSASPLLLRVELSSAIDPNTLIPDANVVLNYSQTDPLADPAAVTTQMFGIQVNFDDAVNELQVTPAAPLAPGYYQLVIQGDTTLHDPSQIVLAPDDLTPLGANGNHPGGQDYTLTFQVTGSEGTISPVATADDTPATAHDLGSLTDNKLVQVRGAIGTDPTDPNGYNPAAVDLYHFKVVGAGQYAFASEVFAGRIGSTLDPSLSLFRLNTTDGQLEFVASNRNTNDAATGTDGSEPLLNDAALFTGLTAGDYYVAVSSGKNVPDSSHPQGINGVFDPNVSHSGMLGNSTGLYVLNLTIQPSLYPPHVLSTSVKAGQTLDAPPTILTVQFDRPVNVQQLAASALSGSENTLKSVYFVDANGNKTFPTYQSYDTTNNQATFSLLNALPNGVYTLHLSGSAGLTDLAGNPLVGNDPSGDYVVHFKVQGPQRGTAGDPTAWVRQNSKASLGAPQVLGTLFPQELLKGVTISRTTASAAQAGDYYQFTLLAAQEYTFRIAQFTGQAPTLTLYANGSQLSLSLLADGSFKTVLQPGAYVLGVSWLAGKAGPETYQVSLTQELGLETGTPLTSGPAPALRLQLVSNLPPASPASPSVPSPSSAPPPLELPPPVDVVTAPPAPEDVVSPPPADPQVLIPLVPLSVVNQAIPTPLPLANVTPPALTNVILVAPVTADVVNLAAVITQGTQVLLVSANTAQTLAPTTAPAGLEANTTAAPSAAPSATASITTVVTAQISAPPTAVTGTLVVLTPLATQAAPHAAATVATVAANTTVPVLPPYLAQALSEGPLGGVRGQDSTPVTPVVNSTPPSQTTATTAIVPAYAAPVPTQEGVQVVSDGTPAVERPISKIVEPTETNKPPILSEPLSVAALRAAENQDPNSVQGQSATITESGVRNQAESMIVGSWWGVLRPTPAASADAQPLSEAVPSESAVVVATVQENGEMLMPTSSWSESSVPALVRWGTISVLGLLWFVLSGNKLRIAQRDRWRSLHEEGS